MILLSPHNDDETIFASLTLQRHATEIQVVVAYDSYVQPARGQTQCSASNRRMETTEALRVMGVSKYPIFLGLHDDERDTAALEKSLHQFRKETVIAPAWHDGGNPHHNMVAQWHIDNRVNGPRYCTYRNNSEKVREGADVSPADWSHVEKKLKALACYRSQISIPECQHFFMNDLKEYAL